MKIRRLKAVQESSFTVKFFNSKSKSPSKTKSLPPKIAQARVNDPLLNVIKGDEWESYIGKFQNQKDLERYLKIKELIIAESAQIGEHLYKKSFRLVG